MNVPLVPARRGTECCKREKAKSRPHLHFDQEAKELVDLKHGVAINHEVRRPDQVIVPREFVQDTQGALAQDRQIKRESAHRRL
jgi:hypothetical protein